jgi:hypothetical protein
MNPTDFSSFYEPFTYFLAVSLGALSSFATILAAWQARNIRLNKLKAAKESRFAEALASDDISVLGAYLEDVVGDFTVLEYASSTEVTQRVDRYLEKVEEFLGTPSEIEEKLPDTRRELLPEEREKVAHEYDKVLEQLRTGESWNALARLRRHIEMTLRGFAEEVGLQLRSHISAGKLLDTLARKQLIPFFIEDSLRFPIAAANRAIHGLDVSADEAEYAVYMAGKGLRSLGEFRRNRETPFKNN